MTENESLFTPSERPRTFMEYLLVLVKWRRVVAINFVAVVVVTVVLSLLVPKWYTSSASLLPSEATGSDIGFLSMIETTFPGLRIPGVSTPSEAMVAILGSRRVSEDVINENDLMGIYRARTMDAAVLELKERTRIEVDEHGVVQIRAEARRPERAASMVATALEALERYNREARSTRGRRTREFVEGRLDENRASLEEAEDALSAFQQQHASIEITEQARAAIEALSEIEAQAARTEIELGILRTYASPEHPDVRRLTAQIREYRRALSDIRVGAAGGDGAEDRGAFASLSELPELAAEYVRLARDVEVLNGIYLFLMQQLEAAKIQEARDTPTIQILDEPRVPEIRTRPRRKVMVAIGGLIGLLIGAIAAFVLEYLSSTGPTDPSRRALDEAVALLRGDLKRIRKV
jgi:uncharacterized protein involved in exopolysaccharide biosynthesis